MKEIYLPKKTFDILCEWIENNGGFQRNLIKEAKNELGETILVERDLTELPYPSKGIIFDGNIYIPENVRKTN